MDEPSYDGTNRGGSTAWPPTHMPEPASTCLEIREEDPDLAGAVQVAAYVGGEPGGLFMGQVQRAAGGLEPQPASVCVRACVRACVCVCV